MSRRKSPTGVATGTRVLYPIHAGPQEAFMQSDAEEALYGGAAGGGKSYALRAYGVNYCLQYPGATGVLFRRTYKELEDTHIDRLQAELPTSVAEYKSSSHNFIFPNGSQLLCRFAEKESDVRGYDTFEADFELFDELTAFSEFQYAYLITRCRSTKSWWPGRRIRSATNPGNIGHCLPYGDVLTPTGWRPLDSIHEGDSVASLDDDDQLVYAPVDHTCKHDYAGDLLVSDTGTAHIACTPYHKIARRTETKCATGRTIHGVTLTPARDLPGVSRLVRTAKWDQPETNWIVTPVPVDGRRTKLKQPAFLSGDDYCALMGWMVSEGYVIDRDKAFAISQCKHETRPQIRALLTQCGFSFRESATTFVVYSPLWWNHFRTLGKCRDKSVPSVIKAKATKRQLTMFLETAMLGDGHDSHYYTISRQLADDIQEIAFKLGLNPRIRSRFREGRTGEHYDVNLRTRQTGWLKKSTFNAVSYNGPVYCLGIANLHRFFIRQHGSIWLSGNSWVKSRFIDYAAPFEIKTGPEDQGGMTRQFIPALATDNDTLMANDPNYLNVLKGLPYEEYRAKALGDWNVFTGQFFKRWRPGVHISEQFTPPREWRRYICVDWGLAAPRAIYWAARPPNTDHIWLYREQYGAGVPTREQARLAAEATKACGESIEMIILDPATFSKEKDADGNLMKSVADHYAEAFAGIADVTRANNERIAGASLFREMLDWNGVELSSGIKVLVPPRLHVMPSCVNFLRTVPALTHSKANVEDVDTDGEDHAYDSVRYLCRYLFDAPAQPKGLRFIDTPNGIIAVPST